MMQKTSDNQINKLKNSEGFSFIAYADGKTDGKQNYSIGYGHQIRSNEAFLKNEVVSKQWGDTQMRKDIKPLEISINANSFNLTQDQFDALIDFGYNAGSGSLAKVLVTYAKTGDPVKVADHIKQYVKTRDAKNNLIVSDDLVNRRNENAKPFLIGLHPPSIPSTLLFAGISLGVWFFFS